MSASGSTGHVRGDDRPGRIHRVQQDVVGEGAATRRKVLGKDLIVPVLIMAVPIFDMAKKMTRVEIDAGQNGDVP